MKMNKKKLYRAIENFKGTHKKEIYQNLTFSIVLVQPETAGNIGFIARLMANFEFDDLIIFNPIESKTNILSYESQGYAMHGKEILLNAEIIEPKNQSDHIIDLKRLLKRYDYCVGTTAKGKRYTNINRLSIFPENFQLPVSKRKFNIAILFGKESRGLTNDVLELMDISIRIPTSDLYPTMNLSHATGIILYEIYKRLNFITIGRGDNPVLLADKEDRDLLYNFINKLAERVKIRPHKRKNVMYSFKNIFERAIISKKELSLILGLFSKLDSFTNDLDFFDE